MRRRLVAKVALRDGRRLVGAVVQLCAHELTLCVGDLAEPVVLPVDDVIRAVVVAESVPAGWVS